MTLQVEGRRLTSALIAGLLALSIAVVSRIHETFDGALSMSRPVVAAPFANLFTIGSGLPVSVRPRDLLVARLTSQTKHRLTTPSRQSGGTQLETSEPDSPIVGPSGLLLLPELPLPSAVIDALGSVGAGIGPSGRSHRIKVASNHSFSEQRSPKTRSVVVAYSEAGGHDVRGYDLHISAGKRDDFSTSRSIQLEGGRSLRS